MKRNYPSPEDPASVERLARVEQQLKGLSLRPPTFDAETIMRAARDAEPPRLPDRRVTEPYGRPARWLTISAAFACGAVAGTLLTCLVLMRGAGADDSDLTTDVNKRDPSGLVVVEDVPKVVNNAPTVADAVVDETAADDMPVTQWSRGDWLVASQWLEMHGPRLTGEFPLRAGDYLRRSTAVPRVANLTAGQMRPAKETSDSDSPAAAAVTPTRSFDRQRLLDEILGVHPHS